MEKHKILLQLLRNSLAKFLKTLKNSWGPLAITRDGSWDVSLFFLLYLYLYVDVLFTHLLPFLFFRVCVAYKQPLLYNLAVTREIVKLVYIRESLQPPSLSTIRSAYSSLWSQINTPGFIRATIKSGEIFRVGVYGAQAYGIFKVRFLSFYFVAFNKKSHFLKYQIGEILGRRSLVGYDLH